jgi:amidase
MGWSSIKISPAVGISRPASMRWAFPAKWTDAVNVAAVALLRLADNLPMGVRAGSRYGDEATLLALAAVLEGGDQWTDRHPLVRAQARGS